MMAVYDIQLTPDDNGTLLITCESFPEVSTFSDTEAEADRTARLAIEEAIAARIANGLEVPAYSDWVRVGRPYARVTLQTEIKVSLYWTLQRSGMSRAELARRLGWHREQVDRLFRLDHASRLDQLEAAFHALGHSIDIKLLQREEAAEAAALHR